MNWIEALTFIMTLQMAHITGMDGRVKRIA
jgi:hypothetical protein